MFQAIHPKAASSSVYSKYDQHSTCAEDASYREVDTHKSHFCVLQASWKLPDLYAVSFLIEIALRSLQGNTSLVTQSRKSGCKQQFFQYHFGAAEYVHRMQLRLTVHLV